MTKREDRITAEQAKAIDFRSYKHLNEYFDKWVEDKAVLAAYKKRTVFNKNSIVFDKDFRFTFKVEEDALERGTYNVWPYLDGELICDYLEMEFAETMWELEQVVISVLYFIRTRI